MSMSRWIKDYKQHKTFYLISSKGLTIHPNVVQSFLGGKGLIFIDENDRLFWWHWTIDLNRQKCWWRARWIEKSPVWSRSSQSTWESDGEGEHWSIGLFWHFASIIMTITIPGRQSTWGRWRPGFGIWGRLLWQKVRWPWCSSGGETRYFNKDFFFVTSLWFQAELRQRPFRNGPPTRRRRPFRGRLASQSQGRPSVMRPNPPIRDPGLNKIPGRIQSIPDRFPPKGDFGTNGIPQLSHNSLSGSVDCDFYTDDLCLGVQQYPMWVGPSIFI